MRQFLNQLSLTILSLAATTGCFGVLVPRIHGLEHCGDYLARQLMISTGLLLLVCAAAICWLPYEFVAKTPRRNRCAALLLWLGFICVASTSCNLALRQDPFLALLNWRAPLINYAEIDAGSEAEGNYYLDSHEFLCFDADEGKYYAAGQGVPHPIWKQTSSRGRY